MRIVDHDLKCEAAYFDALAAGEKTFEVRLDDRGFQRGDTVTLTRGETVDQLFVIDTHTQPLRFRISWILTDGFPGLRRGYVVLALQPLVQSIAVVKHGVTVANVAVDEGGS